ncbi:stage III sporulation protein AA [Bacillus benzoevorans]|uniref:Stage III sporulation protein AA n=1 Tax=Bacillus benzoevorans TaxID=1456 RepID=A0A7X0LW24_9BACI|nr:stage III sporulation protein AA [Bacillus benzoevorans]
MQTVLSFLPKNISNQISQIPPVEINEIEEIRVRISRPLEISVKGTVKYFPYIVGSEDAVHLLNKIGHFSIYALEEELKRGYITIEGGHRVGLAGKVILEDGKVKAIRDVSSFNIRIAREKIGIADSIITDLYDKRWFHTMIIGPPQTGKTTLLRDIARIISSGDKKGRFPAAKVGIIDERSEIAGCVSGIPQMSFGPRIDVMDACPKAEGMMMMIRSMSPEVLIVDEIGRKEDSEAILEAVNAGIKLMMTTHGESLKEVRNRPSLRRILDERIFQRFIILSRQDGPGTVTRIEDGHGRELKTRASVK